MDDAHFNPFQEEQTETIRNQVSTGPRTGDDDTEDSTPVTVYIDTEEGERQQQQRSRPRQPSIESIQPPRDSIQIIDAVKTSEGSSTGYILYIILFEGEQSRRRYSDFHSLRQGLCALHPCIIIPPLPPKNSLSSYAIAGTNPAKAKEDAALVARRRRLLALFLNRCYAHKTIAAERLFRRFLERDVPWSEVIHSPPLSTLPKNTLRVPASDPTSPALLALFASLPLPPSSSAPLLHPDQRFLDSEGFTARFSAHLSGPLEKVNRRLMKRWTEAAADWGEMGGGMNGFALRMGEEGNGGLEDATEKVGMAVDGGYTSTNAMLQAWERTFTEPLAELTQFSAIIKSLLKYRHLKHLQYEMSRELLDSKRVMLEELERSEVEAQRLEKALDRVRIVSDDGARTESANENHEAGMSTNTLASSSASLAGTSSSRKSGGFGFLGAISHTFQGMVDVDPEATRRNSIGKTRESIHELNEALRALTSDLRYVSTTIQTDLDRFQRQKVADIRTMCLDFARFHRDWATKNLEVWKEAREAINNIQSDSNHPPPL